MVEETGSVWAPVLGVGAVLAVTVGFVLGEALVRSTRFRADVLDAGTRARRWARYWILGVDVEVEREPEVRPVLLVGRLSRAEARRSRRSWPGPDGRHVLVLPTSSAVVDTEARPCCPDCSSHPSHPHPAGGLLSCSWCGGRECSRVTP